VPGAAPVPQAAGPAGLPGAAPSLPPAPPPRLLGGSRVGVPGVRSERLPPVHDAPAAADAAPVHAPPHGVAARELPLPVLRELPPPPPPSVPPAHLQPRLRPERRPVQAGPRLQASGPVQVREAPPAHGGQEVSGERLSPRRPQAEGRLRRRQAQNGVPRREEGPREEPSGQARPAGGGAVQVRLRPGAELPPTPEPGPQQVGGRGPRPGPDRQRVLLLTARLSSGSGTATGRAGGRRRPTGTGRDHEGTQNPKAPPGRTRLDYLWVLFKCRMDFVSASQEQSLRILFCI